MRDDSSGGWFVGFALAGLAYLAYSTPRSRAQGLREVDEDSELVAKARAGNNAAFSKLFEKYRKRIYTATFSILKNSEDANDAVQDAFIKAFRSLQNFQGTSGFYTWLYRIATNVALDKLRSRKARGGPAVEFDEEAGGPSDAEAETPETALPDEGKVALTREIYRNLDEALAQLSNEHREVILLREIDGLSYEEMADVLGVPQGTVMSRLFNARKKMLASRQMQTVADLISREATEGVR